jgi:hypothetical protein
LIVYAALQDAGQRKMRDIMRQGARRTMNLDTKRRFLRIIAGARLADGDLNA